MRLLDEHEPWYETVQATLHYHEGEVGTPPGEDASLQQTCGSKGQETWTTPTDYASRVEANAKAAECSPWALDLPHWTANGENSGTAAFKRPLTKVDGISAISLKAGTYPLRGGYYIQNEDGTQINAHADNLSMTIADAAAALAFGSALLVGAIDVLC